MQKIEKEFENLKECFEEMKGYESIKKKFSNTICILQDDYQHKEKLSITYYVPDSLIKIKNIIDIFK